VASNNESVATFGQKSSQLIVRLEGIPIVVRRQPFHVALAYTMTKQERSKWRCDLTNRWQGLEERDGGGCDVIAHVCVRK
jgi:hypothetical protein